MGRKARFGPWWCGHRDGIETQSTPQPGRHYRSLVESGRGGRLVELHRHSSLGISFKYLLPHLGRFNVLLRSARASGAVLPKALGFSCERARNHPRIAASMCESCLALMPVFGFGPAVKLPFAFATGQDCLVGIATASVCCATEDCDWTETEYGKLRLCPCCCAACLVRCLKGSRWVL